MIRKNIIILALLAFQQLQGFSTQSNQNMLTEQSFVSLLTCSPGEELYSVFGHSAIRVADPLLQIDWVFNYGTFDFSDPNFYSNFVRGRLNYILSLSSYPNFRYTYVIEGRSIDEQVLDLSLEERQILLDSLIVNYQPDNRAYLYDFFLDNCATRIRDIFEQALPRTIIHSYSHLEEGKSFRELLAPYLLHMPWTRLGMNLGLGLPSDRVATPWDYMFLPDHMMSIYHYAQQTDGNITTPFIGSTSRILDGQGLPHYRFPNYPFWVFMLVLIGTLLLTFVYNQNTKAQLVAKWFDRTLFIVTGLLGSLISFLWFGTDHNVTVLNLNILWAHPIHLIYILIPFRLLPKVQKYYLMVSSASILLVLLAWPFLPQALPWHIYPLVIALLARHIAHTKYLNSSGA